jgi:hypothetical protein
MKRASLAVFTLLCCFACSLAVAETQTTELVDTPTAGLPGKGAYSLSLRMQPYGGLLGGITIGLAERLALGMSYGGTGIIGYGTPDWNAQVGVQVRVRLLDESYVAPAIAIGFDSQGFGAFYRDPYERYDIKSRGFYAVASKNYIFLGKLGFHAGANYSLERRDDQKVVDFYAGLEKGLSPELSFLADYDFAFNDNKKDSLFGENKGGYLNAGVRWTYAERLSIEFDMKNLFRNGMEGTDWGRIGRTFKIAYLDHF